MLTIEHAFVDILEVEDINLVLSAIKAENEARKKTGKKPSEEDNKSNFDQTDLEEKLNIRINHIFQCLNIKDQLNNQEDPLSASQNLLSTDDEFLIRMMTIPKGRVSSIQC